MKCQGVRVSGYWKGYPCGNDAKFVTKDGKHYCYAHIGHAMTTPEVFEKAITAKEKQDAK